VKELVSVRFKSIVGKLINTNVPFF